MVIEAFNLLRAVAKERMDSGLVMKGSRLAGGHCWLGDRAGMSQPAATKTGRLMLRIRPASGLTQVVHSTLFEEDRVVGRLFR